jgi:hypothetical protein
MRNHSLTSSSLIFCLLLLVCLAGTTFAQNNEITAPASPGYASVPAIELSSPAGLQPSASGMTLVFPTGVTTSREAFSSSFDANAIQNGSRPLMASSPLKDSTKIAENGGIIPGLDTVPTFAGAFAAQAGPSLGTVFPFIFVGHDPRAGGTTRIPAKITAVSLQLLNADGSVRAIVPFGPLEDLTEDSPNFSLSNYTSGHHIQFGDAVHRAQFFNNMEEDWHTVLTGPTIVNRITLTIPRFVNVQFPDGSTKSIQAYILGRAPNGDFLVEMLDLLHNALNTNAVINDIVAGNFTTDAININMYPNTYLFSIDNQGNFAGCCVLGFHTFFRETGVTPQPRWLFSFASWITPAKVFPPDFADVTPLSHELAETFADPFVNTRTPTWQFPNVPATAKICQSNLEEGDPIESLATQSVPITIRERNEVFTYHPQIIPLVQWFEMGPTSNAIGGAFSYPDTTALPHSALPCPQ